MKICAKIFTRVTGRPFPKLLINGNKLTKNRINIDKIPDKANAIPFDLLSIIPIIWINPIEIVAPNRIILPLIVLKSKLAFIPICDDVFVKNAPELDIAALELVNPLLAVFVKAE